MKKAQQQERGTDRSADTKRSAAQCYEDILYLPHYVSKQHPQMSRHDRAAQFAPFAALTAHGAAIRETARLTDRKIELDENSKTMLDQKMQLIQEQLGAGIHPETEITYFVKDAIKEGGAYVTVREGIRKIDEYLRMIVTEEGNRIPMDDVIEII
ncbi:MAG: hypothetical protein ACOX8M_10440 [Marvinbryantia sp.]|jgi:hypothetical protein